MIEATPQPDRFARTCASIDTAGGHILISLLVILMGAGFASLQLPKGEDLIVFALGVLAASMRGNGAENHDLHAPQAARVTNGGDPPMTAAPAIETQNIDHVDVTASRPVQTPGGFITPKETPAV